MAFGVYEAADGGDLIIFAKCKRCVANWESSLFIEMLADANFRL